MTSRAAMVSGRARARVGRAHVGQTTETTAAEAVVLAPIMLAAYWGYKKWGVLGAVGAGAGVFVAAFLLIAYSLKDVG